MIVPPDFSGGTIILGEDDYQIAFELVTIY
jgi:hypothetical protein